jgi:hypothetical protein
MDNPGDKFVYSPDFNSICGLLKNKLNLKISTLVMRRWLMLAFLPLFFQLGFNSGLLAQTQIKVDFGPKVGPNVSVLRGARPYSGMAKPVFGFTAGGFFNVRAVKNRFQFEMDLLFTTRGNKADFLNTNTGENEIKSISVSYLEIPLLFKFILGNGKTARPYVFAGPTYAGILRANFKSPRYEARITNDIKRDDLGLNAGMGLTWFYNDRWYFLDARCYYGFINTSDLLTRNLDVFNPNLPDELFEKDPNIRAIANYYNATFSLTFGISLNKQLQLLR